MKIVFFEVMPEERPLLEAHMPQGHEATFLEEKLCDETVGLAEGAEIISVFVKSELPAHLLDLLPNLKLITTRSMGYDHIDIEHAKAKGIHVNNVTTYAAHPVAEFAFALLLSVTRRIYPAYNQLREGTVFDVRGLGGFNLFGKTLGIVGTGRIGRNVAAIAKGFGMHVVAFDLHPNNEEAEKVGFSYVSLDELLAQSDVISLHVPATEETKHMINAAAFEKMKKGAVLINTARGEIVDTSALVNALKNGTLWGAGLDVLEDERVLKEETEAIAEEKKDVDYETLTANHVLIDMPNVIVTPHIAFETREALEEIARVTMLTITNFIEGTDQTYLT